MRLLSPKLGLILMGTVLSAGTVLAADTTFSTKAFTDVPVGSTHYEAIEHLRTINVLKGYLDGTFKPDARINRAEFVQIVVSPLLLDTNDMGDCINNNISASGSTVFFSDVAKDAWYATNVCFAKVRSLIDGYPDHTFRPAANINFAEAAKITANVFSLELGEKQTGEFWYRPYVQRLSDLHAIPTSIKRFDQILTRGEMAEIAFRLKTNRTNKASASFSTLK